MRYASAMVVVVLAMLPAAAQAEDWYIPMREQLTGGFDHMQALITLPKRFSEPAASLFWAYNAPADVDALAAQWFQHYNNTVFLCMDGLSIGDYELVWDWWLPEAPPAGTSIRFQAYLGDALTDSADLVFVGPNHEDWDVRASTWGVDYVLHEPEWIIGDADLDSDVDWRDYQLLEAGFGSGTTWFEGNFDGDGDVDWRDYQLLEANFGYPELNFTGDVPRLMFIQPVPEPATLTLAAAGLGLILVRRRK